MAADEIRRSGRATKGQHTKNIDEPDASTPRRAGKGGRSKANKHAEASPPAEDDDGDAIIRCICGYAVEDEDDERPMVICDNCSAWQHIECMGLSDDPDDLPDQYFCEQCKPADHKELLVAVARGEKPWEERAAQREQREKEEKLNKRRKGGKKGKKGRPSNAKPDEPVDGNGAVTSPVAPASPPPPPEPAVVEPKLEVGQKRKLLAEMSIQTEIGVDQGPSKVRKVSSPKEIKPPPQRRKSTAVPTPVRHESRDIVLQTELVENVSDLQSDTRKRAASALVKLFIDLTQQAQVQGAFKVPPGQSSDAFSLRLGLAVEYAVYLNFWGHTGEPSPNYPEKLRMILYNVRANTLLRDRLLTGALSPNDFSQMGSFDMASKELQEKTTEMIKEADKQHMLIQEEAGPRIRRTHKGDEIVGEDVESTAATESIFTNVPPRRRESEIDPLAPKQTSPAPMSPQSPHAVELPQDVSQSGFSMSPTNGQPLAVDTKAQPRLPNGGERKSSSNFNIQEVWSSVDSPDTDKQRARQLPHLQAVSKPEPGVGSAVQQDAEIDHLLKDEDQEDEEPYSPTDFDADPGTVWRGNMAMLTVAEFRGIGKHVAGANLSSVFPWNQLMPNMLSIEGRIDTEKASTYLCGLQWSKTTDVSVIAVAPIEAAEDQAQFDKLFTYFTDRKRYGVIAKSPIPAVRDIYVVPLEPGASKKPEFIELLEHNVLEEPRPSRMLLITYVIKTKTDTTPSAQATPRHFDAATAGSPITVQGRQFQTPIPVSGSQMSPIGPYASGSFGSPLQPQQPYPPPYNPGPTLTGMEAARQVLGTMADAPAVRELLSQAPNTGVIEFGHIKEVFESVPGSLNDLNTLMSVLTTKTRQGKGVAT